MEKIETELATLQLLILNYTEELWHFQLARIKWIIKRKETDFI